MWVWVARPERQGWGQYGAGTWRGRATAARSWGWGMQSATRCQLLQVIAKTPTSWTRVSTKLENYSQNFEIDKHHIVLSIWDTLDSFYYDNIWPLAYPDSDTVSSALTHWTGSSRSGKRRLRSFALMLRLCWLAINQTCGTTWPH